MNILLCDGNQAVKLIDLGISKCLKGTIATSAAQQCTPRYISPEQLKGYLSIKNDIWAFGGILLQFATGVLIYDDIRSENQLYFKILLGETPLEYMMKFYEDKCKVIRQNKDFSTLLEACFNRDHQARPSAARILKF